MSNESFAQLTTLFLAGVGLLLVSVANGLLRQSAPWKRLALTVAMLAGTAGAAWAATDQASSAAQCGGLIAIALIVCCAAGSEHLATFVSATARSLRQPIIRWSIVGLAGVGTAVGSVVHYDQQEDDLIDTGMVELETLTAKPPVSAPSTQAFTDQGSPLPIQEASAPRDDATLRVIEEAIAKIPSLKESVIRRQPATDKSNCHGWIFTEGRYWLSGMDVEKILAENGYAAVTEPKPGDLIIYRSGNEIIHSGVVRYVTEGYPVIIESKWGSAGVFLHPPEKTLYGIHFVYYRSVRKGHLVAGLTGSPPASATVSQMPPIMPNPDNPDEYTE